MYDSIVEKMSECLLFLALTIIMLCKVFVFAFFSFGKNKLYCSFSVLGARQCGFACPNLNFTIVCIHIGVICLRIGKARD